VTPFMLHLLRHGAPEGAGRLIGHTDAAPTDAGIVACLAQAESLAVDAVIASDLARARRPAEAIATRCGLQATLDARWRELDFGDWEDLATDAIDASALGRFWADPDASPPPGGERWCALRSRVGAAIEQIAPRPTLIVTHASAMRAALAHLCGFAQRELWAIDLPYAALLSLRVWPGSPRTAQIVALRA
jgi:alpha-ribazole phosphatase